MRPSSLIVQSTVLTAVAALVVVVMQAEFAAPKALQPATNFDFVGREAQSQLELAAPSRSAVVAPDALVDGAQPERVSEHAVRVLDRDTGAPVSSLDLYWLPIQSNSELRHAATTDADGLAIVTVRGEGDHVLSAWLGTRSIRPTGMAHGPSSLDRPRVLHLAGTASVRGRVLNWDFALAPRHSIQAHLQIPMTGATHHVLGARQPVTHLRDDLDDEGMFEFSEVPTEVEGLALGAVDVNGWLLTVTHLSPLVAGETRVVDLELTQQVAHQWYKEAEPRLPMRTLSLEDLPQITPGNQILRGVLIDHLLNPVANTEVAALAVHSASNRLMWRSGVVLPAGVMTTQTDSEGRFEFVGIGDRHVLVGRLRAPRGRSHTFARVPPGPRVQVIREP